MRCRPPETLGFIASPLQPRHPAGAGENNEPTMAPDPTKVLPPPATPPGPEPINPAAHPQKGPDRPEGGGEGQATNTQSGTPDVFISYASQDAVPSTPTAPQQLAAHHLDAGRHHGHAQLPPLRFIEELKRRNVGRVAVLYIVVSYVVLEVFEMFFHLLEMPPWTGRAAVLIAVLGFPITLLIAWAYEITPEGLKPTDEVPTKQSIRHQTRKRLDRAIFVLMAVALAYFIADKFWLTKHAPAEQPTITAAPPTAAIIDKSIAVLPFTDMSEKHDQEYFSDGLSEELIDHLAHITDLKVIARTSSFAFKGKNEDMRTIATKLGVANLLEGSVRKAGSTLRITAQLIRASDGVHLWSQIYNRKLNDIFKVQDEISTTVAKALNVALNASNSGGVQPASKGTGNIEAYNLVLKGNYFFWRGNQGDDAKAVELFQQALKLEPRYALAWAKLARVYAWQGFSGELTAAEAELKGRDAVERALAIDPNYAEAYYARGQIYSYIVGDWTAAISDYERAATLDPHSEVGEYAQGNILDTKGALSSRLDDSIDWGRRYIERNSLDTNAIAVLALTQLEVGRLEESAVTYRRLLELNPAYETAQAQYALTLLLMGKNAEALAVAEKEPDEAWRLLVLACIHWTTGRRAESDSAIGRLERGLTDRNAYEIAAAHSWRGEAEAALAWLKRAYDQRKGSLLLLKVDPLFRNLHGDPRFDALLRKAKLTE
jgi:adenylate cyclase